MKDFPRKQAGEVNGTRAGWVAAGLAAIVMAWTPGYSQENNPPPDFSKALDQGVTVINPIDKFLSIEGTLQGQGVAIDWKKLYLNCAVNLDAPAIAASGDVKAAMALGMKVADGVIAIKARHNEGMKDCARAIETLAKKLGVTDDELGRARKIEQLADKGLWMEVFSELGFYQEDIMRAIEEDKTKRDKALLILLGIWVQGGKGVTDLVTAHYSPGLSNVLREPKMLELVIAEIGKLPEETRNDPLLAETMLKMKRLHQIMDVGLRDPIPQAQVVEFQEACLALSALITQ